MNKIEQFFLRVALSIIRKRWPQENSVSMAVDAVIIVRFIKSNLDNLSRSSIFQLVEVLEDRIGNLASSFKGWDDLFRERETIIRDSLNEYLD